MVNSVSNVRRAAIDKKALAEVAVNDQVRLIKYPPNRGMMDWDRVLHVTQLGIVIAVVPHEKLLPAVYLVWFTTRDREGYEVYLAQEHFERVNTQEKRK